MPSWAETSARRFEPSLRVTCRSGARPEKAEAVGQDDRDEAGDHEQAETEGARGEPHERLTRGALPFLRSEAGHSALYLSRSRWRTISASVLTTKVMAKSSRAARNSTR